MLVMAGTDFLKSVKVVNEVIPSAHKTIATQLDVGLCIFFRSSVISSHRKDLWLYNELAPLHTAISETM